MENKTKEIIIDADQKNLNKKILLYLLQWRFDTDCTST